MANAKVEIPVAINLSTGPSRTCGTGLGSAICIQLSLGSLIRFCECDLIGPETPAYRHIHRLTSSRHISIGGTFVALGPSTFCNHVPIKTTNPIRTLGAP